MSNSVNIPQANSVETLTYVIEAIRDGVDTTDKLVAEFDVRDRTIHYYLELAEWLGFIRDRKADQLHLTEAGAEYANEVNMRAVLYRDGVMQHPLVRRALEETPKRDEHNLRKAFVTAITDMGVLAEATAKRRAGALMTLTQAALPDAEVDWHTGRFGQPTKMKRNYVHDKPDVDESAETATFERPRDPQKLVGEERFDDLGDQITAILEDIGKATSSQIRDELAERFEVPLTDPKVFVVLREGLASGRWLADHHGRYSI